MIRFFLFFCIFFSFSYSTPSADTRFFIVRNQYILVAGGWRIDVSGNILMLT